MKIVLEILLPGLYECVGFSEDPKAPDLPLVHLEVIESDLADFIPRHLLIDGSTTPGTQLLQEDFDEYQSRFDDAPLRRQKVIEDIQALIGRNITSLTDAERWKLVGAVFYKLGVINSSGNVNPFSDWTDV
jgi:hypothetical protein